MNTTLMIVGIGDLAGLFLNHLVQRPPFGKIILAGRNTEEMNKRKNLALLFASQLGYHHTMECARLDLFQVERNAELIAQLKPDIIFNTATLQSWRIITYLPKEIYKALDEAQFGPWLPMHLTLTHKLMLAVRMSGAKCRVVNAAFPDAVGPVLRAAGLAPEVGIGNVANVIPAIRGAIALDAGVSPGDVDLALFAQHYFSHRLPSYGDTNGAPFRMSVRIAGKDATDTIPVDRVFHMVKSDFARTGGAFRQLITAASALSVIDPMLEGKEAIVHAPAPEGLPGGYRVKITRDGISVAEDERTSVEEARRVNEACQKWDGIDSIDEDGVVHFRQENMAIMKEMLNYDCPILKLEESEERAKELGRKYAAFRTRYE